MKMTAKIVNSQSVICWSLSIICYKKNNLKAFKTKVTATLRMRPKYATSKSETGRNKTACEHSAKLLCPKH